MDMDGNGIDDDNFEVNDFIFSIVGSIFLMVVVSMLPHVEIGGNDHREDAPQFMRMIV